MSLWVNGSVGGVGSRIFEKMMQNDLKVPDIEVIGVIGLKFMQRWLGGLQGN